MTTAWYDVSGQIMSYDTRFDIVLRLTLDGIREMDVRVYEPIYGLAMIPMAIMCEVDIDGECESVLLRDIERVCIIGVDMHVVKDEELGLKYTVIESEQIISMDIDYKDADTVTARQEWTDELMRLLVVNNRRPFPDFHRVEGYFSHEFPARNIYGQEIRDKSYPSLDEPVYFGLVRPGTIGRYLTLFQDDADAVDVSPKNISLQIWYEDMKQMDVAESARTGMPGSSVMVALDDLISNIEYFIGFKAYMDYLEANAPIALYPMAMDNDIRDEYNTSMKSAREQKAIETAREEYRALGKLHEFDPNDRSQWELYYDFTPLPMLGERRLGMTESGNPSRWVTRESRSSMVGMDASTKNTIADEYAGILGDVFVTDFSPAKDDVNLYAVIRYDISQFNKLILDAMVPYVPGGPDVYICPDFHVRQKGQPMHSASYESTDTCVVCGKALEHMEPMPPAAATQLEKNVRSPFVMSKNLYNLIASMIGQIADTDFVDGEKGAHTSIRSAHIAETVLFGKVAQWVDTFRVFNKATTRKRHARGPGSFLVE